MNVIFFPFYEKQRILFEQKIMEIDNPKKREEFKSMFKRNNKNFQTHEHIQSICENLNALALIFYLPNCSVVKQYW